MVPSLRRNMASDLLEGGQWDGMWLDQTWNLSSATVNVLRKYYIKTSNNVSKVWGRQLQRTLTLILKSLARLEWWAPFFQKIIRHFGLTNDRSDWLTFFQSASHCSSIISTILTCWVDLKVSELQQVKSIRIKDELCTNLYHLYL